jgi:hypothetical protein
VAPGRLLPPAPALMRLAAPRSVVCDRNAGPLVSRGTWLTGLSPRSRFLRRRPPSLFGGGFILPRAASSSERREPLPAPDRLKPPCDSLLRRKRLPWGSDGPSSRRQPAGATCRRKRPRLLLRSVLGVPPALDGLLPDRSCGFVSPRSRVQGSLPSGVCSSARSRAGSSPADALGSLPPAPLRFPAPRRLPPTSGPCSPLRVRWLRTTVRCPMLRAPLGLVLLRVLPPRATAAFAATAHGLARNEPAARDPRRVAGEGLGWPGIRLPTRSRFPACFPPSLTRCYKVSPV